MFHKTLLEILQESDYIGKVNSRIGNYKIAKSKELFKEKSNNALEKLNKAKEISTKLKKLEPHFDLARKRAIDRDINSLKANIK